MEYPDYASLSGTQSSSTAVYRIISSGQFSVGIYLSSDAIITTGDTLIGTSLVNSLAPGEQTTVNTSVTIPAYMPSGTYYLGAIADYNYLVLETNKSNNALAGNNISVLLPVRIAGTSPVYYQTPQLAYDAAVDGDVIQCAGTYFNENININRNINVTLDGGYDSDFSYTNVNTNIYGSINVSNGKITIKNFELRN